MVDQTKINEAADILRNAAETGIAAPPIRDLISDGGLEAAYAVQDINTEHWLKSGRRLVGRKTGLTSKSVQKQLGVNQPDYGMLFADMDVAEGEEIALDRVLQPKAEAEVAFVIGADLDQEHITMTDLTRSIEYAVAAIEVVGSRVAGWDIKISDTIADNASSGLYVLGTEPRSIDELDLRLCGMVMERKGDPVSVGAGAACLGHPMTAALWLAKTMAKVGRPLREGDTILSGALGPMVNVAAGDVIEARINGLGSVRAAFGSNEAMV